MKTKKLLLKTSISFTVLVSFACATNPTTKSNDFSSNKVLYKTAFTPSSNT